MVLWLYFLLSTYITVLCHCVICVLAEDSKKAKSEAYGIMGPIPIPYPLPDTDGCKGMRQGKKEGCPIKKGQEYTYDTELFVKTSFPSVSLANRKKYFCFPLPSPFKKRRVQRLFGKICGWKTSSKYELPHDKTNKMTVRLAKTQISQGIHPV